MAQFAPDTAQVHFEAKIDNRGPTIKPMYPMLGRALNWPQDRFSQQRLDIFRRIQVNRCDLVPIFGPGRISALP